MAYAVDSDRSELGRAYAFYVITYALSVVSPETEIAPGSDVVAKDFKHLHVAAY